MSFSYQTYESLNELVHSKSSCVIAKLNSNEFPFEHSEKVRKVLTTMHHYLPYYPLDNNLNLRVQIAHLYQIKPEQILITAGSSEAIYLAMATYSQPNSSILISQHAFQLYQLCAGLLNRNTICIDETQNYEQNLDLIIQSITPDTTLIFLTNPSNPLGTWIRHDHLERFLQQVPSSIYVIIDEAYFDFMENEPLFFPATYYLKYYKNLIITRTFSKFYGLAGARIGYAIADPATLMKLKNSQLPCSVNFIGIELAKAALTDHSYYQTCHQILQKNRNFLFEELTALGFPPIASSANFLTFYFGKNASYLTERLLENSVYVTCLHYYKLPEYIRVSIGTMEEILLFLNFFRKIINTINPLKTLT
jgi:histidinol-phosphate aminotransferase